METKRVFVLLALLALAFSPFAAGQKDNHCNDGHGRDGEHSPNCQPPPDEEPGDGDDSDTPGDEAPGDGNETGEPPVDETPGDGNETATPPRETRRSGSGGHRGHGTVWKWVEVASGEGCTLYHYQLLLPPHRGVGEPTIIDFPEKLMLSCGGA